MSHDRSPSQIARLRLQAQSLVGSQHTQPVDAVRSMLAMQGQDFAASQWAMGSRVPGSTRADVRAAYDAGELVRGWPMRGTLHVTCAEDLGWMAQLATPGLLTGVERRWDYLGIDQAFLDQAREIAEPLLSGGTALTRSQFVEALVEAGLECSGQRGYHTIWYLSQTGLMCWGPLAGDEQQLVLQSEWITSPRELESDAALAELARRYFDSHGPATIKDLQWWCKLPMKDVRAGHAAVLDELVEITCAGTSYWVTSDTFHRIDADDAAAKRSVLALAPFDEHLLGYGDRDLVLDPAFAERIVPGRNGMFKATIVDGGSVVGTWSRTKRAKATKIEAQPFAKLAKRVHTGFSAAAKRWGAFTDTPVDIIP